MVVTLVCFSAVLFMSTGSKEKVYDTHTHTTLLLQMLTEGHRERLKENLQISKVSSGEES